ncbi:hypothetical protein EYC80_002635 [Monilinia laxa]|uniref:Uncharacterized protein n=1 Tax=Monilinia laxa TaxID=61186 RepID=A0A5N6K4I1_MONLA|nr:hypothetical protein EYC80_002635 [Monilinia laxa]
MTGFINLRCSETAGALDIIITSRLIPDAEYLCKIIQKKSLPPQSAAKTKQVVQSDKISHAPCHLRRHCS